MLVLRSGWDEFVKSHHIEENYRFCSRTMGTLPSRFIYSIPLVLRNLLSVLNHLLRSLKAFLMVLLVILMC